MGQVSDARLHLPVGGSPNLRQRHSSIETLTARVTADTWGSAQRAPAGPETLSAEDHDGDGPS